MADPLQDNPLTQSTPAISASKTDTEAGVDPITPPVSDDPNEAWMQEVIKRTFALQDMFDKRSDMLNAAGTEFLKTGKYVPPTIPETPKQSPAPETPEATK